MKYNYYLSDLDVKMVRHGWQEVGADKSTRGTPITIAGKVYEKGLGTHATSDVTIELRGKGKRFTSWVGVDDNSLPLAGAVCFQVTGSDGRLLWQGPSMRNGDEAVYADVNIENLDWITLEVLDGDISHQYDDANWADAQIWMSEGEPRTIQQRYPTLIEDKVHQGKSASDEAVAFRLPFRKVLEGAIDDWVLLTIEGAWAEEYFIKPRNLPKEGYVYNQRRGRSSASMKPWWILRNRKTNKGLCLTVAYMGNWTFSVQPTGGGIEVLLDTSPSAVPTLDSPNGVALPCVLASEFEGHWDYGAQPIVRFAQNHLLRDLGPEWPVVQYNTWYTDWDFLSVPVMLDSIERASNWGCEQFVVDAGWYGGSVKATSWIECLGDWVVNKERLPNGIEQIAEATRAKGMKFGMWVEIEAAHPLSPVGVEHPEWFLEDAAGERIGKRDVLDFGKKEVLDWAKGIIDGLMERYQLDYIKMDMNVDPYIDDSELPDSPLIGHYKGLIELWKYMRERYPALVIENCSSGSLRQDYMAVPYTDTHWVSDGIDHRNNVPYMMGATYMMPASVCSHWTVDPDWNCPYMTVEAQFLVHMMGHFGISGHIDNVSEEVDRIATDIIAEYKKIRQQLLFSDVYHLTDPWDAGIQVAQYVDRRTGKAMIFAFQNGNERFETVVHPVGLSQDAVYRLSAYRDRIADYSATGNLLSEDGIQVQFSETGDAVLIYLDPEVD